MKLHAFLAQGWALRGERKKQKIVNPKMQQNFVGRFPFFCILSSATVYKRFACEATAREVDWIVPQVLPMIDLE